MSNRSRQLMNIILKKVGGEQNLAPGVKEKMKQYLPNTKIIMGRAHRGLFAGKHIKFGDQTSKKGGNTSRRSWKPNIQEKRLFSYILDRHIRVKVSIHALRCIDLAGGIDEYLLKTPYKKMDTELGIQWKLKIEKLYAEFGEMEVVFFSPEEEAKIEEQFKKLKVEEPVEEDAEAGVEVSRTDEGSSQG